MAPLPPPNPAVDFSNIGFGLMSTNGHVECKFKDGQYGPIQLVRSPYMRIHGLCHGLNYGQQGFEGMKAYRAPGDEKVLIFRPELNAARMAHTAEVLSIPPVPQEKFIEAVNAAVALNADLVPPHNSGASLYIRPLIFGSEPMVPPNANMGEHTFCVYVNPAGAYHGMTPIKAVILDDFDRAAPKGVGHAKAGGNYAPVMRHARKAHEEGFGITLHLDSATHTEIDEFSTSGFIGVKRDGDDIVLVVPDSPCIIASVTSRSIQDVGRMLGMKVEKRPVMYEELLDMEEVGAVGTAVTLAAIRSITRRVSSPVLPKGHPRLDSSVEGEETVVYMPPEQDRPGPICEKLLLHLKGIQCGRVEDTEAMTREVTPVDLPIVEEYVN